MMLWYTARGAGLSALVLLSLSTCLGALMSRQPAQARRSRPAGRVVAQYLHRALAALGLAVLGVHIGTIVADSYAHVGLTGALIPFASGYRPGWVSFGVCAAWLFVIISVLGAARGRLAGSPRAVRTWRTIHALSYLGWASAIVHGFTSGTDSAVGWVRAIYLACLLAVLASAAVRLRHVVSGRHACATPSRPAAPSGPAAAPLRATPSLPAAPHVLSRIGVTR